MATKAKKTTKTPEPVQAAERALTPQQERFVSEYLIDLNATQAATRAGYSAKTAYSQGQRLLKDVEVAKAIETGQAALAKRNEVTQDDVLNELRKMAFSDIRKVYGPDGKLLPIPELSDDMAGAITAVDAEVERTGTGSHELGEVRKYRVADKLGPLKLYGQHLGLFGKRLTVDGKLTVETLDTAALDKLTREEREFYVRILEKLTTGAA